MPTSTPNTAAPATGCPYRLDLTGSDIQSEAAALRELGPATRVLLPGDIPAWSVTDPGLIRRLLTHPDISKDAAQHWPAYTSGQLPADWPLRIWVDVRNALSTYGKEHHRLRRPLAAAFSSRRVRALVPQIENLVHTLLDELQSAAPDEVVDLRARFAWRLPLLVAGAILGVGEDLHNDFRDAVGALFATDLAPEEAGAAQARVYELIDRLIEQKKAKPGDDVTSGLIAAQQTGDISDTELRDSLVLLIGAGHETTVNALDHGTVNLLTHRDQLTRVQDGEVAWDQLTEEVLRHQAPIATIIMRFAVTDVVDEATGVTFARGDALVINYAAAGRDPEAHGPDADKFDTGRTTARDHLAFGHGTHFCLGAELARIEIRIALDALFTRFPDLQLAAPAEDLAPLPSFISNGHVSLPVRLGQPTASTTRTNPAEPDHVSNPEPEMTITDTPPAPTLLTQDQRGVAARLVYGASNQLIARQEQLAVSTVASHLAAARRKLDRPGSSRAVLTHALLTAGEVPPPSTTGPAPEFTEHDRRVIWAVAEHTRNAAIGEAIGVCADDVRAEIDAVVAKAGASNEVHLVGLGHAWNILRGDDAAAEHSLAEPAGAVR